jgi:hypothetical protein
MESGNEIPEDATALTCSAAICGAPVQLSSSGLSTRTLSEATLKVREIIGHPIHPEAMVVDIADISVTRISDEIKKVDEDRSHPKMA